MVALSALVWGLIIVRACAPGAERRGGHWALEAILLICGPVLTLTVALYPESAGEPGGIFPMINRAASLGAVALAVVVLLAAIKKPRQHAGLILLAVGAFYSALWMSALAGVVPAFPEAYWTTPLVILPFLIYGGFSTDWLLRTARVSLRLIVVMSFAVMFLMPDIAFNLEEARTVFGINRFQGIVTHPNGFAALAVLGLLLELHGRTGLVWKLLFLAGVVLAQSSTAYIALLIALLVMAGSLSIFLRVAVYIAGLGMVLGVLFGGVDWLQKLLPEQAGTLTGRTAIWEAALFGFQQGPFFGYGPTLLGLEFRNVYLPGFDAAAQAHNQWVQSLGGEGVVGTVALALLVLVLVTAAFRTKGITSGLSVGLVAFLLVRCITETPLRPSGPGSGAFTIILIFGLLAASLSEVGPTPPTTKQAPLPDWTKAREGALL